MTQNRKLARVSLYVPEESMDYLKTLAGLERISVTGYINNLIDADRKERAEVYKKAKQLQDLI